MGRLLATIPLVVLVLINTAPAYLGATVLFAAGSVTDSLDGRLARRYHLVSRLCVFLDLTPDKIFLSAALIALVPGGVTPPWLPTLISPPPFFAPGPTSP